MTPLPAPAPLPPVSFPEDFDPPPGGFDEVDFEPRRESDESYFGVDFTRNHER